MISFRKLASAIVVGTIVSLALTQLVFGQGRPFSSIANLKTGPNLLAAFKSVSREVRESVVTLSLDGTNTLSLGTIIDADGLVISKSSELRSVQLKARLANSNVVAARVIVRDPENDVALIKIEAKGLKPIDWTSDIAKPGQWSVSQGVDPEPDAVGIVSTPSRRLTARAYLGIGAATDPTAAPNSAPPRIGDVTDGFGAASAGLRRGDVILAVNNGVVRNWEELVSDLRLARPGDVVRIRFSRDGQEQETEARLFPSAAPEGSALRIGLTQAQQVGVSNMNENLAPLVAAAASARAALAPAELYLNPLSPDGIANRVEALRRAELEFAEARAAEATKLAALGIDVSVIQDPSRNSLPTMTEEQQNAINAMGTRLLPLVQAANAARNALSFSAIVTQPIASDLLQSRIEALRMAELNLAQARAQAMEKLQSSRAQVYPEQIATLVQQSMGGTAPRRGGIDRQTVMNRMGGEISERRSDFESVIQHDTVLDPSQCGGPLVNLQGKAIGLNIARDGRVASYALPSELVMRIIDDLRDEAGLN